MSDWCNRKIQKNDGKLLTFQPAKTQKKLNIFACVSQIFEVKKIGKWRPNMQRVLFYEIEMHNRDFIRFGTSALPPNNTYEQLLILLKWFPSQPITKRQNVRKGNLRCWCYYQMASFSANHKASKWKRGKFLLSNGFLLSQSKKRKSVKFLQ